MPFPRGVAVGRCTPSLLISSCGGRLRFFFWLDDERATASGMRAPLVGLEVAFQDEALVAERAREGPVVAMMPQKKDLVAVPTLKRPATSNGPEGLRTSVPAALVGLEVAPLSEARVAQPAGKVPLVWWCRCCHL